MFALVQKVSPELDVNKVKLVKLPKLANLPKPRFIL
jgi:hypothetical protein